MKPDTLLAQAKLHAATLARHPRPAASFRADVGHVEAQIKAQAILWEKALEAAVRGDDDARERLVVQATVLGGEIGLALDGIAGGGA